MKKEVAELNTKKNKSSRSTDSRHQIGSSSYCNSSIYKIKLNKKTSN
jgi:hypothetical protein